MVLGDSSGMAKLGRISIQCPSEYNSSEKKFKEAVGESDISSTSNSSPGSHKLVRGLANIGFPSAEVGGGHEVTTGCKVGDTSGHWLWVAGGLLPLLGAWGLCNC